MCLVQTRGISWPPCRAAGLPGLASGVDAGSWNVPPAGGGRSLLPRSQPWLPEATSEAGGEAGGEAGLGAASPSRVHSLPLPALAPGRCSRVCKLPPHQPRPPPRPQSTAPLLLAAHCGGQCSPRGHLPPLFLPGPLASRASPLCPEAGAHLGFGWLSGWGTHHLTSPPSGV